MSRFYSTFFTAGLIITIFLSVLLRGAFLRVYTAPSAILLIVLSAVFLFLCNNGMIRPKFNYRTDLLLLSFIGWLFISAIFSIDREQSFFEFQRYLLYVGAYYIAGYGINKEDHKTIFLISITGIGLFEAIYGLWEFGSSSQLFFSQWIGLTNAYYWVSGTFGNHNQFAGLMSMCAFIGLGLLLSKSRRDLPLSEQISRLFIMFLPIGLIIVALVFSLSRGGWISFATGAILVTLILINKKRLTYGKIIFVIFLVGVVSSAFIIIAETNHLVERISTIKPVLEDPFDVTSASRLSLWESAAMMIKDRPLTGTGVGTFKYAFPSYRNGIFKGAVYAHNGYLQIASGSGIAALIFYVVFWASVILTGIRLMKKKSKNIISLAAPGLLGAIFAVLVHEFVDCHCLTAGGGLIFFAVAGLLSARGAVNENFD